MKTRGIDSLRGSAGNFKQFALRHRWFLAGALLLAAGTVISLLGGNASVSSSTLLNALIHRSGADVTAVLILYRVRIPRLMAGLVCGAAPAVSGLLLQEALRNPLASPALLGLHNGAGLLALAAVLLFGPNPLARSLLAFLGAMCSMLLILLIARFAGTGRSTLLLAGVAVSALMSAGVNLLITLRPESVADRTAFQMGSLHGIQPGALGMAAALTVPGLAAAFLLAGGIDLLSLGDEAAHGLGLPVRRYRALAMLTAALLCAAAVSACGLISFVGLIIPNLVRRLTDAGTGTRAALCSLLGGGFLILCDVLARSLAHPYVLTVGIILSFLGAPFFVFLLIARGRKRWT